MITNFKIFESNVSVNIDIPEDILNNIISTLSFVGYKGRKRDEKRHKNYKSIRVSKIDGYYNKDKVGHDGLTSEMFLQIEMNNKDKIEAKYVRKNNLEDVLENSIYVEINGDPILHLDSENYGVNSFIEMIGSKYQKYIQDKKWKLR